MMWPGSMFIKGLGNKLICTTYSAAGAIKKMQNVFYALKFF